MLRELESLMARRRSELAPSKTVSGRRLFPSNTIVHRGGEDVVGGKPRMVTTAVVPSGTGVQVMIFKSHADLEPLGETILRIHRPEGSSALNSRRTTAAVRPHAASVRSPQRMLRARPKAIRPARWNAPILPLAEARSEHRKDPYGAAPRPLPPLRTRLDSPGSLDEPSYAGPRACSKRPRAMRGRWSRRPRAPSAALPRAAIAGAPSVQRRSRRAGSRCG